MILNKNILDIRWGTQVKHFLKLSQKYASILCYEVRSTCSESWLQAEPLCATMCFSVFIQSLDKFDLRVFCRTCSWIQSVLRSHRTSNTLKHPESPLQGETFLIDGRINILHSLLMQSTIESCSLLLKHMVPSCLPTMLSEVLGDRISTISR